MDFSAAVAKAVATMELESLKPKQVSCIMCIFFFSLPFSFVAGSKLYRISCPVETLS